jgi:predicted Zn-dependent protease
MKITEEDLDLIDRYLNHRLTADETSLFSRKKQEQDFFNELQQREATVKTIRNHFDTELKKDLLAQLDDKIIFDNNKTKFVWYYTAAACLAIALLTGYFFLNKSSSASQEIFLAYYKPYPALSVTRGASNSSDDMAAFDLYQSGNYAEAANHFNEILKKKTNIEVSILLANCYLQTNRPERALDVLNKLNAAQDAVMQQHVLWYTALAYLKKGNRRDAVNEFEKLSLTGGVYSAEATEIINKIKK